MASTYVNDLRLNEMATGDASGTWGTVTNTNLELIAEAFSFGTEAITTNADTHTTTIADGSTDPGRSMFLKYTGTLDSACTITIGPNTVSKLWFIENGTSGSQNIIISQGTGANVTIPAGDTKVVYSDGAGSGAAVVDAFASISAVDLKVQDDLTVTDDATIGGTLGVTGVLTANAGVVVDNITIDGTEIDLSSGSLTLNVAGNIILDADGGEIEFKDGGTTFGNIAKSSNDMRINQGIQDGDIVFRGNDGGSIITALTIDMSDAGKATFNGTVKVNGAGNTLELNASSGVTYQKFSENGTSRFFLATLNGADGLAFVDADGSAERMRVDSGGHVLVNTTSEYSGTPSNLTVPLAIDIHSDDANLKSLFFSRNAAVGEIGGIAAKITGFSTMGRIDFAAENVSGGTQASSIRFKTTTGASESEKMRILGNGQVCFNSTEIATASPTCGFNPNSNTGAELFYTRPSSFTGTGNSILNYHNGSYIGGINTSTSATIFLTSSDYRLKENIKPLENGLDRVSNLKPVQFDWKVDGKSSEGFIAHEAQEIFPDAVSGEKDDEKMQAMDYGRITPLLVKAIQEQQELIETQQTIINDLKSRVETLEG
jgi:hypothetical protein